MNFVFCHLFTAENLVCFTKKPQRCHDKVRCVILFIIKTKNKNFDILIALNLHGNCPSQPFTSMFTNIRLYRLLMKVLRILLLGTKSRRIIVWMISKHRSRKVNRYQTEVKQKTLAMNIVVYLINVILYSHFVLIPDWHLTSNAPQTLNKAQRIP